MVEEERGVWGKWHRRRVKDLLWSEVSGRNGSPNKCTIEKQNHWRKRQKVQGRKTKSPESNFSGTSLSRETRGEGVDFTTKGELGTSVLNIDQSHEWRQNTERGVIPKVLPSLEWIESSGRIGIRDRVTDLTPCRDFTKRTEEGWLDVTPKIYP